MAVKQCYSRLLRLCGNTPSKNTKHVSKTMGISIEAFVSFFFALVGRAWLVYKSLEKKLALDMGNKYPAVSKALSNRIAGPSQATKDVSDARDPAAMYHLLINPAAGGMPTKAILSSVKHSMVRGIGEPSECNSCTFVLLLFSIMAPATMNKALLAMPWKTM